MRRMIYLKNVTTIRVASEKCSGCGVCLDVCPHGVLALAAKRISIVEKDACMECGACARNCPQGAISVSSGVGCAAALLGAKFSKSGEICCDAKQKRGRGCC